MKKSKAKASLRHLAVNELQSLLGSEPKLARAFAKLAKQASSPALKTFCREGVEYTERRVQRIEQALALLEAPAKPRASAAMPGLIEDALAAGKSFGKDGQARDAAIMAAIERISHYGLASYAAIERFLGSVADAKVRRVLSPSTREKRDAIGEESRMARRTLLPAVKKR